VPKAITWLKQAAHFGDTDAMESLAIIYLLGIPDPVSPISPDPSMRAILEKNEGAQQDRVRSSCHNAIPLIQKLTPEHVVKTWLAVQRTAILTPAWPRLNLTPMNMLQ
jgi:hypothetical protein